MNTFPLNRPKLNGGSLNDAGSTDAESIEVESSAQPEPSADATSLGTAAANPSDYPSATPVQPSPISLPARWSILQAMVPIASNLAASQLEAFAGRLADALFRMSDQAMQPEDAATSFQAFQLLKRHTSTFYRLVAGQIHTALAKEIAALQGSRKTGLPTKRQEFSLVSFEDMEVKVLIRNLSQSLELNSSAQLIPLNARMAYIVDRPLVDVAHNPFRPEVFVRAVHLAWVEFDENRASHLLVLRLLQPSLFLQLISILKELNDVLSARGIVANLPASRKPTFRHAPQRFPGIAASNPYIRDKLNQLFDSPAVSVAHGAETYNTQSAWSATQRKGDASADAAQQFAGAVLSVDRQFFDYLYSIQNEPTALASLATGSSLDTSTLRLLMRHETGENLSEIGQNTIELLARIFEFVFNDPGIPEELKALIGNLQIPTLRAALLDKNFFFSDAHPARVLIDMLAKSSIFLDTDSTEAEPDPLYQVIEDIVERVQQEFDHQIDLFSDVVDDLEAFLREEELQSQQAISQPVVEALKSEKRRLAREFAAHDVALRIDTGEVAGFVELFLKNQWAKILSIAHCVKEERPVALENALRTMDDLIWSLKPKTSAEERKELVSKLPAMLSLLNAWLNTIKWDDPERVLFFSKLAERHAAIARAPLELSPRRQIEIAVNIAQRASERHFQRSEQDRSGREDDCWRDLVQSMEQGIWIDLARGDGNTTRCKLAWVSPKRARFIFTNRQGYDAFSISSDELLAKLRDGSAVQILAASVVDRALLNALRDPED